MVPGGDCWADIVVTKGENQALAPTLPPGRASQLDPLMNANYQVFWRWKVTRVAIWTRLARHVSANPKRNYIDDDVSVRDGLSSLIESVGLSVQAYTSATEFLNSNPGEEAGCVVLDVNMPGMNGLELQREMNVSGIPALSLSSQ